MVHFTQKLSLLVANFLIPVAVVVFGAGFFRYKPSLSPFPYSKDLKPFGNGYTPPKAPFDKIVFMVVDALRRSVRPFILCIQLLTLPSDFMFSINSGFKFTQR